jgi:hypothetical protein
MVHAVHDTIGTRTHIRGSLGYISGNKKEAFPKLIHTKGSMSSVAVLHKSLHKKRQVPMGYEKQDYY